ncbi:MAG TPA: alpha/beta fold hydrolase [Terriglobales bacterium]|nr:alpha/beta fold hydrolase [Terriglobales bacterium]
MPHRRMARLGILGGWAIPRRLAALSAFALTPCRPWKLAIRVPTLILHAEDDPFMVITAASRRACAANPAIRFEATPHGGHCPFINSRRAGGEVYWGERRVVEFSASRPQSAADSQLHSPRP